MGHQKHRDCICGSHPADMQVPAKDWLVSSLTDRGPGQMYRYHVRGENLNLPPCHPDRRFSWSIPAMCERYDLSHAVKVS